MEEKEFFMISIAAKRSNMHPQTIRVYEMKGLIIPKRSEKKTRLYSDEDIKLLQKIQALTELGMSLEAVAFVLKLEQKILKLEEEVRQLKNKG